jgi:succinate dehydrogenase/fumarate reductase flavoprotein subunit
MELATVTKALNELGSVSMSAVLILIIIACGYLIIKLVQRAAIDNTSSERIAAALETNNAEMAKHREFMGSIARKFDSETTWLRDFVKERMDQEMALSRLEQSSRRIIENIEELRATVAKITDRRLQ